MFAGFLAANGQNLLQFMTVIYSLFTVALRAYVVVLALLAGVFYVIELVMANVTFLTFLIQVNRFLFYDCL